MQARRLLGLISDLRLDDEEVDIAMRSGLPARVRAKQDHLFIGSGGSKAASPPPSTISGQVRAPAARCQRPELQLEALFKVEHLHLDLLKAAEFSD
jgi:hypothetical protein